jgi:hypothetical protein
MLCLSYYKKNKKYKHTNKLIQKENNMYASISYKILMILIFTASVSLFPQQQKTPPDRTAHSEKPEDNYKPVSLEQHRRSPAYSYSTKEITTVQVNVDSSGRNIINDAANEPSIAIDRNNPDKMVIGWRQFYTISSDFRQAGYAYTINGGANWIFPGVIDSGVFRSDPVLESDAEGNFYYNSLTSPGFFCTVFKSTDGGATWDGGTDARGGDKQWMTIDKTGRTGDGNIYAYWTSFFTSCDYSNSFTRSKDRGESFEECIPIPENPYWGQLSVNSSGELYLAGSIGANFVVVKSLDAQDPYAEQTWNMAKIIDLDGVISVNLPPNPGGLAGQTNISIDTSGGKYSGNVYVLCSVSRYSNPDPLDVMFTSSADGGNSWSEPVRINDDSSTSAYQWFGTMSVGPNGRIDAAWLDTRDDPENNLSALYYSYSIDGGLTWSVNRRLSDYFDSHLGWPKQNKLGDYFDMISDFNGAHLAWAATFNGEQDVYYSYISYSDIVYAETIDNLAEDFALLQNYPNPFNPVTKIMYQLPVNCFVSIKIFDLLGQEISLLVNEEKTAGTYELEFDARHLSSGIYFYQLKAGNFNESRKMSVIK